MKCLVNEIYPCFMGESTAVGLPAALVRLSGCNLNCTYCDTAYSRSESGTSMELDEVVQRVADLDLHRVLITGGEPMLQASATGSLAATMLDRGWTVYVETNGSLPLGSLPEGVIRIVDVKTPGSGCGGSFLTSNLQVMRPHDELKFVITSRTDYDWSKEVLKSLSPLPLSSERVLFSPCSPSLAARQLADWILEDRLDVRFHIQMHKYVWGDARGV